MSQNFGQPTPPPAQAPSGKPKNKALTCAGVGCAGVLAIAIIGIIAAALGGTKTNTASNDSNPNVGISTTKVITTSPSAAAPATSKAAAPATSAKPQQDTVTYVVTGSHGADVQYGSAGSNSQGHVPMTVTKPLGHPIYYSITAQLQGGGSVTCEIKVNGKVISKATANGGYNIAMCEISQDPLSGEWTDTNQS